MGSSTKPSPHTGGQPVWVYALAILVAVGGYAYTPTRTVTTWVVAIVALGIILKNGATVASQVTTTFHHMFP